jgi:hypothetical protein
MGENHLIEYDEVVGCDRNVDKDGKVQVHRKAIFRKLDGFDWMSEELEKQNIPSYVFLDMWKALYADRGNRLNPRAKRKKKGTIATSCAIKCSDTIHQGELHILAAHSSPLIFNNTCWSWYEVASFFLSCGSRGYIGTLWAIDNDAAILGARTFYDNVFSGTILNAFQKALASVGNTQSENIYVFWGLHFTRLSPGTTMREARSEVLSGLVREFMGWKEYIEGTKSSEGKRHAGKVMRSLLEELEKNFTPDDFTKLQGHLFRPAMYASKRSAQPTANDTEVPIPARRSLDYTAEAIDHDEGGSSS